MALITQSIDSLVNGVSQQPPVLRLPSQAEAQVNCISSAVDGVRRRPPTVHIAKVGSGDFRAAAFHLVDRDPTTKYAVILDGTLSAPKVYDLKTGAEKTVNADPDINFTYLVAADAAHAFRAITVGDYTYIVNREVEVGASTIRAPTRPPEALVFFRAANYRERFTLTLDGHTWTVSVPGSAANDNTHGFLMTDALCGAFATLLSGSAGGFATTEGNTQYAVLENAGSAASLGYTVVSQGSCLHITKTDGTDFNISVSAGGGGDDMVALKGTVQRFSDLPRDGIDGFTIRVQADPGNEGTDYYVTYVKNYVAPPAPVGGSAPPPVVIETPPAGGPTGGTTGGSGGYGGVTPYPARSPGIGPAQEP